MSRLDPDRGGNPLRRSAKIAGQQHHVQPAAAQCFDRRARLGKRRIVERQHGMHPPAPTDIDHRMTARLQRSPMLGQGRRAATSPVRASRRRSRPPPAGPSALPRMPRPGTVRTSRVTTGSRPRAAAATVTAWAKAMLGMALQPGSPCEHLVGPGAIALDADNMRSARRERAGLVEGEQSRARESLERAGVADQAAAARQPPDAERGRKRRGETHRARTGNHQHRETNQQCPIERQPLRPIKHRQPAEGQNEQARRRRPRGRQCAGSGCAGPARREPIGKSAPNGSRFPRRCFGSGAVRRD